MATTQDTILDAVSKMTVLELADLIKAMEEKFGVSAAAPVAAAGGAAVAAAATEEQTEFDVILIGFEESKKINVIKIVREVTGLGLAEAKGMVEAGGKAVKEGISKQDAEALKAKLTEAGAKVEVK